MSERTKVKIVYLVPHYWGVGESIDEARKNCREAGATEVDLRKTADHQIWVYNADVVGRFSMDDFGCMAFWYREDLPEDAPRPGFHDVFWCIEDQMLTD